MDAWHASSPALWALDARMPSPWVLQLRLALERLVKPLADTELRRREIMQTLISPTSAIGCAWTVQQH